MFSMIEPSVITHFLNHCYFPNPNGLGKWENEISVPQCGEDRGVSVGMQRGLGSLRLRQDPSKNQEEWHSGPPDNCSNLFLPPFIWATVIFKVLARFQTLY